MLVILISFLIKSLTSLNPGSEISGEPASETSPIFELYWYFDILLITNSSL